MIDGFDDADDRPDADGSHARYAIPDQVCAPCGPWIS
jgi:hypothetical protein